MDLPGDDAQRIAADVLRFMRAGRLAARCGVQLVDFNAGHDSDLVQVPVPGGAIHKHL
jgi:hypothetical protein